MEQNYSSRGLIVYTLLFTFLVFFSFGGFAQVGIGNTNPDESAYLEIGDGTDKDDKGLLIPRVELANLSSSVTPIASPKTGLLVYNTLTATGVGFYYWNGARWVGIDGGKNWQLSGNGGTIAGTDFLGTTDNIALQFKTRAFSRFEITTGTSQAAGGRLRAFTNGTASEPIYSWNSNVGTGMFQQAANVLSFATNGTERFRIPSSTNQVQGINNGSASYPFYSWASNSQMGMFAAGTNILAFSTNTGERIRILANGQVIVNKTTALAGDRFTVQGNNNEYAINGLTGGSNVAGIYGENISTNGIGVFGNANIGLGVVGQSTGGGRGIQGSNTGNGHGVIGFAEVNGIGVQGQNNGAGLGVLGITGNNGVGVHGESGGNGDGVNGFASGLGDGVYGQNTGNGYGVHGLSNSATSFAIRATQLNNGGTALLAVGANGGGGYYLPTTGISANGNEGLFSWGKTDIGTGVIGTGNNSAQIVTYINGSGVAGSGTRTGVFGYAGNGARNNANRGNAAGIFSLDTDNNINNNNSNNDNGIRASAILAGFDNIAFNSSNPDGSYNAQDSYFGGYFSGGTQRTGAYPIAYAYVGLRYGTNNNGRGDVNTTDFKIVGMGSVATLINDDQNVPRIMFAPEAPEIVFQDYGIGQLINGQATILLDPILKKSLHIDSQHPLKVFVTLEGDCKGVYVTNKSADGFTVKELQNGTSNVPFSWQIVANRADTKDGGGNVVSKHVGLRLPVGPGPIISQAKQLELKTEDRKHSLKEQKDIVAGNFNGREFSSSPSFNEQSTTSEIRVNTTESESTSPTNELGKPNSNK